MEKQNNNTTKQSTDAPMKTKFSRKIAYVTLGAVIVALAIATVFVGRLYYAALNPQKVFNAPTPRPSMTVSVPEPTGPDEPVETLPPEDDISPDEMLLSQADLDFIKDRVNILLLGIDISDERENTKRDDFRTDVMMLLSVDFENNKVYMVSVPRDSYTKIYNSNYRYKINGAFAVGGGLSGNGFEYARETISILFGGVPVPYHAAVKMSGIKKLVDSLGGIDYDVDLEIRLNGRVLKKGYQHLDGQQVLDYCRARKGISTDVGRIDRQQRVMFEVFRELKASKRLSILPRVYLDLRDSIYTNLSLEQIAALATFAMEIDPDADLSRHTLAGEYMSAYNAAYYVLDQKAKVKLVKEVFGIDIKPMQKYDLPYVKSQNAGSAANTTITKAQKLKQSGTVASDDKQKLDSAISKLNELITEGASSEDINIATAALETMCTQISGKSNTAAPTTADPAVTPGSATTPAPSDAAGGSSTTPKPSDAAGGSSTPKPSAVIPEPQV